MSKKSTKAAAWILLMSMCAGAMGLPGYALNYLFSESEATADNGLFVYEGVIVTDDLDPATLDKNSTHYYAGNGNFSRYSSAHLTREGFTGEEPVCLGSDGTPYYVGVDHSIFEDRGLIVDDYYMDGDHITEKCYARWDYIQQFVLADTATGKVATAYCADQITSAEKGFYYNIENIEDADYYNDEQAAMIRSITANGYWGNDSEFDGSIADFISRLEASGEFTPEELACVTEGIAMTATQYAIWEFSNYAKGDKRISAYITSDSGGISSADTPEEKAAIDLIFKIYYYLISLEPTPAVTIDTSNTILTEENFLKSKAITAKTMVEEHPNNADEIDTNDAYYADISFALAVDIAENNGDVLSVKVTDAKGDLIVEKYLAGGDADNTLVPDDKGVYTLEDLVLIEGYQTLNIVLQGHQQLKRGVYLYTAADGASASQTLVGIAEGPYQVNADLEWTLTFDEKTTYTDSETVFLNKIYDITNAGTSYPTETFTFDIEPVSVTDAAAGVTVANMPVPTVGDVTFWTEDGETTKQVKIDIPPYNSVGIYTYTIRENAGDTAGVTYYGTPIELKVTVIQDTNGKLRVAAIRTGYKDSADKSGDLVNVYSAGELSFTKTVTGNMGDQSKYFPITVTLTGDSGKKYSAINASETPYSKTITNEDGTTTTEKNPTTVAVGVSTTFYLKHGDTVHLTNIPYGVTYTVTEPEPGDYDMSIKGGDNDNGTGEVDSADEGTVTVINEKTETVDTGISVDSVPYIALLGAVTLGGGGYIISKKRRSDDDD